MAAKPNKAELIARAEQLGLDTQGTKTELTERILAATEISTPVDDAAVRAAELAAQTSVCRWEGERPVALDEALQRRVSANLAATGGTPLQACGGADPDVQRLEAPYRKPRVAVVADSAEEQPPSGSLDHPNQEEE